MSGSANGSETITVNPVTNSIYDIVENVASTSQSNNTVSLNSVNYVLELNGSNEEAYVADDPAFESTDLSIQVWVDPGSLPSSGNQAWFVNKNKVYRIGRKMPVARQKLQVNSEMAVAITKTPRYNIIQRKRRLVPCRFNF